MPQTDPAFSAEPQASAIGAPVHHRVAHRCQVGLRDTPIAVFESDRTNDTRHRFLTYLGVEASVRTHPSGTGGRDRADRHDRVLISRHDASPGALRT